MGRRFVWTFRLSCRKSSRKAAGEPGHTYLHNTAAGSVTMPTELPLLPPSGTEPVKRGRGRPRVVRSNSHRGSGLGAMYQCGHCNGKGHNSRTCPMNQKPEVAV